MTALQIKYIVCMENFLVIADIILIPITLSIFVSASLESYGFSSKVLMKMVLDRFFL